MLHIVYQTFGQAYMKHDKIEITEPKFTLFIIVNTIRESLV